MLAITMSAILRFFNTVVGYIIPNHLLRRFARYIYKPHTTVENCEPPNCNGCKDEYEGKLCEQESQTPVENIVSYETYGCNFKYEGKRCSEPKVDWKFCEDHSDLHRKTHTFYKSAEARYKGIEQPKDERGDGDFFEQRHKFLLLAISARIVHTELFFHDSRCDGHQLYLSGLKHSLLMEEQLIWMRKGGFVVEGASYDELLSVAIASFRQACIDWSKSDKQQEIGHFIHSFPRAISSGTTVPDAVLKSMEPQNPDEIEW